MKRPRLLRVPCKHGPGARHVVDGAQDSGSAARSSAADVMATSELGGPGNPTPGGLGVWLKQGTETAKRYSVIFGIIRYWCFMSLMWFLS